MPKNLINPLSYKEVNEKINDLKNRTVGDISQMLNVELNSKNKGQIGQLVEKYIGLENNNISMPDLGNVELKTIGIKMNKDNKPASKERLIISKANFDELKSKNLEENENISKIKNVLYVCYEYVKGNDVSDFKFLGGFLNNFLDHISNEDKETIYQDYEILRNKVINNQIKTISSSDTQILELCTKSANSSVTTNYNGEDVKPRAWALKTSFMTKILNEHFDDVTKTFSIEQTHENRLMFDNLDNALNRIANIDLEPKKTKMYERLGKSTHSKGQNAHSLTSFLMDYLITNSEAGDIENIDITIFKKWLVSKDYKIKTISVDENNRIHEDMSFRSFQYLELHSNDYKNEPTFYQELQNNTFIFMISKKIENEVYLKKIVLHKFNEVELNNASLVINKTKEILEQSLILEYKPAALVSQNGSFKNNFPKSSNNEMFHVRPHASNRMHMNKLPDDTKVIFNNLEAYELSKDDQLFVDKIQKEHSYTNSCFFLNKKYLQDLIKLPIIKKK